MAWKSNIILTIISLAAFYFLSPETCSAILFQGVLLNIPYIIVLIPTALGLLFWSFKPGFTPGRRFVTVSIFLSVVNILWCVAVYTTTDYITYKKFADFQKIDGMIATDLSMVRYNAIQIAYNDMENSITTATEEIKFSHSRPIILEGHFGFVTPITPDGTLVTFSQKNPGFVFFDDSYDATEKVRRLNQPYEIGQDMQIFDNLDRHLYLDDLFAEYEEPHYLALDPKNPKKLTAVVPKIKYSWLRFPYWAGVVLVHDDGTVEGLSKKEALADTRLQGKWIFPMDLAREYVDLQNYAVGWGPFSSIVRVKGKFTIEDLPGDNDYPLLMQGADGHTYHYVATKAEGSGSGLFRMYYVDASSGKGSYVEYDKDTLTYGAEAARKRIQNLSGYTWHRETSAGESGNMIAVEPVYIVRKGDPHLYWKFSITNKDYAGTSAVAVTQASNLDNIMEFKTRSEFEAWKNGAAYTKENAAEASSSPESGSKTDEVLVIRGLLEDALRRLSKLEQ